MLNLFDYIYYLIYIVCLILSFKARESIFPGLSFLRIMLCFGLGAEAVVELLQFLNKDDTPPYYVYIPMEYYCLSRFYEANTNLVRLKYAIRYSVPVYLTFALLTSFFYHRFTGYPSALYNINCLFSVIWITLLLFNFSNENGKEIWTHPLFIILSAFLIFFSGVFFFNPAYTFIHEKDAQLADSLRKYINIVLNYILYILLSIGFVCSTKTTK